MKAEKPVGWPRRDFKAPLCCDCAFKMPTPFAVGYCRRWFWLENGVPTYGRSIDMRLERCGQKEPRFFIPKVKE